VITRRSALSLLAGSSIGATAAPSVTTELQLDRDVAWVFSVNADTRIGIERNDLYDRCDVRLILIGRYDSQPRYVDIPLLPPETSVGVWQEAPSQGWAAATPMPTKPPGHGVAFEPHLNIECVGDGPHIDFCGIAVGRLAYFVVRGLRSFSGPFTGPKSPPTYLLSLNPANGKMFTYVFNPNSLPVAGLYYRKSRNRICIAIENAKDIEVEPLVG